MQQDNLVQIVCSPQNYIVHMKYHTEEVKKQLKGIIVLVRLVDKALIADEATVKVVKASRRSNNCFDHCIYFLCILDPSNVSF